MNKSRQKITKFWLAYLHSTSVDRGAISQPEAWGFGDSAEMADKLGQLVLDGLKTATSSLSLEYEQSNEDLPVVGELSIILNGKSEPICIIETTEIRRLPFNQVDESFAFDEGEGDLSLGYWQDVHRRFFSRRAKRFGAQFDERMTVICERFRVIYPGGDPVG